MTVHFLFRYFAGCGFAPGKSALSLAKLTMQRLKEEWCSRVPGLWRRLLIATIGATVDHAAFPEFRALFKLIKEEVKRLLAEVDMELADVAVFAELAMVVIGDHFHKTGLVCEAFGNSRTTVNNTS